MLNLLPHGNIYTFGLTVVEIQNTRFKQKPKILVINRNNNNDTIKMWFNLNVDKVYTTQKS